MGLFCGMLCFLNMTLQISHFGSKLTVVWNWRFGRYNITIGVGGAIKKKTFDT